MTIHIILSITAKATTLVEKSRKRRKKTANGKRKGDYGQETLRQKIFSTILYDPLISPIITLFMFLLLIVSHSQKEWLYEHR
jgi:hypothetical protein